MLFRSWAYKSRSPNNENSLNSRIDKEFLEFLYIPSPKFFIQKYLLAYCVHFIMITLYHQFKISIDF